MPRNTSYTLGNHFDKFLAEKIKEYSNLSEAVRAGLHKLEEDDVYGLICRLST